MFPISLLLQWTNYCLSFKPRSFKTKYLIVRIWNISVNNILLFISGTSSHRHQCKVAFYNTCISKEDCISSCSSMGASKYRWFRNGCCQCIGSRCHDYGELNPLCKECQADWSWSASAANSRSAELQCHGKESVFVSITRKV